MKHASWHKRYSKRLLSVLLSLSAKTPKDEEPSGNFVLAVSYLPRLTPITHFMEGTVEFGTNDLQGLCYAYQNRAADI
jgi:hypothetical protein